MPRWAKQLWLRMANDQRFLRTKDPVRNGRRWADRRTSPTRRNDRSQDLPRLRAARVERSLPCDDVHLPRHATLSSKAHNRMSGRSGSPETDSSCPDAYRQTSALRHESSRLHSHRPIACRTDDRACSCMPSRGPGLPPDSKSMRHNGKFPSARFVAPYRPVRNVAATLCAVEWLPHCE